MEKTERKSNKFKHLATDNNAQEVKIFFNEFNN